MNTLSLTDKELELIITTLEGIPRYTMHRKESQELLVKLRGDFDLLCYTAKSDKTGLPLIFESDEQLARWLRGRGVEGTDEYVINESIQIGEVEQIKRSELTDTE